MLTMCYYLFEIGTPPRSTVDKAKAAWDEAEHEVTAAQAAVDDYAAANSTAANATNRARRAGS